MTFPFYTGTFRSADAPLQPGQLLLRKQVYQLVTRQPDLFDMADWETVRSWEATCRTTRCIAGWAQFLVRGKVSTGSVEEDAIRFLGLTEDEYKGDDGGEALFYLEDEEAVTRLRELAGEEEEDPGDYGS